MKIHSGEYITPKYLLKDTKGLFKTIEEGRNRMKNIPDITGYHQRVEKDKLSKTLRFSLISANILFAVFVFGKFF